MRKVGGVRKRELMVEKGEGICLGRLGEGWGEWGERIEGRV